MPGLPGCTASAPKSPRGRWPARRFRAPARFRTCPRPRRHCRRRSCPPARRNVRLRGPHVSMIAKPRSPASRQTFCPARSPPKAKRTAAAVSAAGVLNDPRAERLATRRSELDTSSSLPGAQALEADLAGPVVGGFHGNGFDPSGAGPPDNLTCSVPPGSPRAHSTADLGVTSPTTTPWLTAGRSRPPASAPPRRREERERRPPMPKANPLATSAFLPDRQPSRGREASASVPARAVGTPARSRGPAVTRKRKLSAFASASHRSSGHRLLLNLDGEAGAPSLRCA